MPLADKEPVDRDSLPTDNNADNPLSCVGDGLHKARKKLQSKINALGTTTVLQVLQILFAPDHDTRMRIGDSLMEELDPALYQGQKMQGLIANQKFRRYSPVAVLGYTGMVIPEHQLCWFFPTSPSDKKKGVNWYLDKEKCLAAYINSNQGPSWIDPKTKKPMSASYGTNCAITTLTWDQEAGHGKVEAMKLVVYMTTEAVRVNEEFVTYYDLPLDPPYEVLVTNDYPTRLADDYNDPHAWMDGM